MTPESYCQNKATHSGSSFYYAFLFLPEEQKKAIHALYAFCREVDDIVDECSDSQVAKTKLAWWQQEVLRMDQGQPTHPVTKALLPFIERFQLSTVRLQEIIDGMMMDLTQNRYLDFASLKVYCFKVASVVGLLSAQIFGYRDQATLQYAESLGLALQMTNIIRDVGEDARRGRIYLPLNEMQDCGVSVSQILSLREDEAFYVLIKRQIERARQYYQQALSVLPQVDRRTQRPGLIMAAIYRALLEEIEKDGCHVLQKKIALTPLRKLWIAWRTWAATG